VLDTLRWAACIWMQVSAYYTRIAECQLHTKALMAKSSAISVRVPDEVKAAVEKAAAADSRSVASYVEKLLAEHLRKQGFLKK
jgi:hypothetical protein